MHQKLRHFLFYCKTHIKGLSDIFYYSPKFIIYSFLNEMT